MTTYLSDAFGRTVGTGWGTADTGGSYLSDNDNELSVGSGVGSMACAASASANAELRSTTFDDQSGSLRWSVDDLTASSGNVAFVRIHGRTQNAGADSVRFEHRISYIGDVDIQLRKTVSSSVSTLNTYDNVVTGYSGGGWATTKWQLETSGSDLIFRFKVWKDGDSEPGSWTEYTAVDIDSVLLNVGWWELVSQEVEGSQARNFDYDDLLVTSLDTEALTARHTYAAV